MTLAPLFVSVTKLPKKEVASAPACVMTAGCISPSKPKILGMKSQRVGKSMKTGALL